MNDSAKAEALCVRVLWGEHRVATHVLHPGESVQLGSNGERSTRGFRFAAEPGRYEVTFAEGVVGSLLRNGETELSLGDVIHKGLASEDGADGWSCELGRSDVLTLGGGPVQLEAFRVKAPAKAVAVVAPDYNFLNTLLVCFALFAAMAMHAEFQVDAEEIDDSVSGDLTRMRRILVQAEKPQPKPAMAKVDEPAKKDPIKKPAPGSPRPPTKPVKDPGGSTPQVVARDLAGRLFGGPGAAGILGPGGLGKDIAGALGNVVAMNGNGNGGWSIKGDGAGGPGGDRASIGAIARSGVDKKGGIGRLVAGKDVDPTIDNDPPILCNGGPCMDKDLIRKVIASHRDQVRYCYELALQRSPALAGKVAVQFMVATTGDVPMARVDFTNIASPELSDCLVSRVRSWHFPVAKEAGGYRVTYPFVFKPTGV